MENINKTTTFLYLKEDNIVVKNNATKKSCNMQLCLHLNEQL